MALRKGWKPTEIKTIKTVTIDTLAKNFIRKEPITYSVSFMTDFIYNDKLWTDIIKLNR